MVSHPDANRQNENALNPSPPSVPPLAGVAKKTLEEELEGRRHQVESRIESMVHSMHDAVDLFHDEDEQMLARGMDYAASRLDALAKYLKDRSFRGLRDDAAGLARDHSVVFLGAALIGGALIGRFLRSSARSRSARDANSVFAAGSVEYSPEPWRTTETTAGLMDVDPTRPAWMGNAPASTMSSTQGPPPGRQGSRENPNAGATPGAGVSP